MIWPERLLAAGFKPTCDGRHPSVVYEGNPIYKPLDNWYGVSTYAPDQELVKGDSGVILTLQGLLTPNRIPQHLYPLASAVGLKYIGVYIGGSLIWETWTGELPPEEIIERLCE